jgi:hypothetical protein
MSNGRTRGGLYENGPVIVPLDLEPPMPLIVPAAGDELAVLAFLTDYWPDEA